jgi:hypothetical protein
MTATTSTAIAVAEPLFTGQEELALAGFLAGYTGLTREAYALDLRQYASWCHQHQLRLFQARRADIECFARDVEAQGRARRGRLTWPSASAVKDRAFWPPMPADWTAMARPGSCAG